MSDKYDTTKLHLNVVSEWVDMEALESKNHASLLCFFDSLGAIRQVSSLESAADYQPEVRQRHSLSA